MHREYYTLYGGDFISSIRRLGLMTFRMAMIMTTLRIMDDGDLKRFSFVPIPIFKR
jgi:hypothetical protein